MTYPTFTNPPNLSPITGDRNSVISSHQNWQKWWIDTTPKLTTLVSWMNGINANVETKVLQVEKNTTNTYNARDRAEQARDEAISARNAIQGYVIPTNATYSKEEINDIVEDLLYNMLLTVVVTENIGE